MHHVYRGPEPVNSGPIRDQHTRPWIRFYRDGMGSRPSDSHWRRFAGLLENVFGGLCAFCEEHCKGEVEHFLPKSLYPHLVYYWSNWLFSCHDCNNTKGKNGPNWVMSIRVPFQNAVVRRSSFPSTPRQEKFFPKMTLTPFNTGKRKTRSMIWGSTTAIT